jgi:hypothetical protein
MKLPLRECAALDRDVDPVALTWLDEEDASTEDGLLENHDYCDLRGLSWSDAMYALRAEALMYEYIELAPEPDAAQDLEEALRDKMLDEGDEMAWLDFGVASTVVAISAMGGIPITSCNGGVLGGHHGLDIPSVQFYALKEHVPIVVAAAERAQVAALAHHGRIEVFTPDLRRFHTFARALSEIAQDRNPSA